MKVSLEFRLDFIHYFANFYLFLIISVAFLFVSYITGTQSKHISGYLHEYTVNLLFLLLNQKSWIFVCNAFHSQFHNFLKLKMSPKWSFLSDSHDWRSVRFRIDCIFQIAQVSFQGVSAKLILVKYINTLWKIRGDELCALAYIQSSVPPLSCYQLRK